MRLEACVDIGFPERRLYIVGFDPGDYFAIAGIGESMEEAKMIAADARGRDQDYLCGDLFVEVWTLGKGSHFLGRLPIG